MRNEDLLIEIGTEELPPNLLKLLIAGLGENIGRELTDNGFEFEDIETHGTARRMATIVRCLEERQADKESEKRGPSVEMAYNKDGEATPALNGFLRACGISDISLLQRSRNRRGEWLVYREHRKGRTIGEEIQGIIDRSIEGLTVARPMRWSNLRQEFVRPVHWVMALFGSEMLELEVFGCTASNLSYGHRFMHPDPIAIGSAKEYVKQCWDAKVIVDPIERENLIREKVQEEGIRLGGEIDLEDHLVEEVSALVEWPAVLSGNFDEEFLDLPEDVLISVMKKHQRYFHLRGVEGKLLAKFITVANVVSKNPEVVIRGNERVIKPRLRDAQFFFVNDTKSRLEEKLSFLEQVTFQKELGSYRDKAGRISKLAGHIAEKVGWNKKSAERAGLLCKVDLVTNLVEEFPELQGKMGGHYASIDGEHPEICSAIREHYKPSGPGDTIPGKGIGSAVAIADKLDTLVGIFGVGGGPTGSKDPYALRRQTLGVIRIVLDHKLDINIKECLAEAMGNLKGTQKGSGEYQFDIIKVHDYIVDRLQRYYQEIGIDTDVVRAVRGQAGGIANLCEADEAIRAIQEFKAKDKGKEVIALSKRVANILNGHSEKELPKIRAELYEHKAERTLDQGMEDAEYKLGRAKSTEEKLVVLEAQGPTISDYFDSVLVMDDDKDKRLNRLAAIARMNNLFSKVADFKLLTVL